MKRFITSLTIAFLSGILVVPAIEALDSSELIAQTRGGGRRGGSHGGSASTPSRGGNNGGSRGNNGGTRGGVNSSRPNSGGSYRGNNGGSRPDNSAVNRPGNNGGFNHGGNNRPGNGNVNNGNNRPDRPNNDFRPGNGGNRPGHGNVNNGGGNRPDRPGNGGYRPGYGNGNNHPNHGYRPGGHNPAQGGNSFRPGNPDNHNYGHRPGHGPNHRPGGWRDHYRPTPPPVWRPAPRPWYRPTPPPAWRPTPMAPRFATILGVTLGTALDLSLDYLFNGGYSIASYGNGVVVVNNVNQLNYMWPEATLYYGNSGLSRGEFVYYTPGYDTYRYNSVYSSLVSNYGSPIGYNNVNGGMSTTWFGPDGRFVTLEYAPRYGGDGVLRYYTTLSFGM